LDFELFRPELFSDLVGSTALSQFGALLFTKAAARAKQGAESYLWRRCIGSSLARPAALIGQQRRQRLWIGSSSALAAGAGDAGAVLGAGEVSAPMTGATRCSDENDAAVWDSSLPVEFQLPGIGLVPVNLRQIVIEAAVGKDGKRRTFDLKEDIGALGKLQRPSARFA
jgi:hypothetical protein